MKVYSDSGDTKDLDFVYMSEVVLNTLKVGLYENDPDKQPIDWWPGDSGGIIDQNGRHVDLPHGTSPAQAVQVLQNRINQKPVSFMAADQYFIFSDMRTGVPRNADGSGAMIVTNSGFRLLHQAVKDKAGKYFIKVSRKLNGNNGAEMGDAADTTTQYAEIK